MGDASAEVPANDVAGGVISGVAADGFYRSLPSEKELPSLGRRVPALGKGVTALGKGVTGRRKRGSPSSEQGFPSLGK